MPAFTGSKLQYCAPLEDLHVCPLGPRHTLRFDPAHVIFPPNLFTAQPTAHQPLGGQILHGSAGRRPTLPPPRSPHRRRPLPRVAKAPFHPHPGTPPLSPVGPAAATGPASRRRAVPASLVPCLIASLLSSSAAWPRR